MSECTCPHGDAREPDHDRECPARPIFDRFRARELLVQGRHIEHVHPADHRKVLDGLVEQLQAAIDVIDAVPFDALSRALMPRTPTPREVERLSFYETTSAAEVIRERDQLRAECDRMRPVFEAAVEWRSQYQTRR